MKTKLIAIVALCLLLPTQNLFAWNGHVHRVIASIAFLQLSSERHASFEFTPVPDAAVAELRQALPNSRIEQ